MAAVLMENLMKHFAEKSGSGFRAVNEINLSVSPGEFMVLVGPSGCGKSTTLRMIAGLEDVSGGTISIDGRVVNDVLPKDRDIAMVFQSYALYPHMTVYDNMAFGLKLRKIPAADIECRVKLAAGLLGLTGFLDCKPKTLSGGQRQRVAVGRAIVRQPKVFLFDEPLSNLDAKMRVSMRDEIVKLHRRLEATIIYVTHDQIEAMTMGDRICVMRDGNIMQVGKPLEIYNCPANLFVAGFIGSPPMNFFRGTLQTADGVVRFVGDSDVHCPLVLTINGGFAIKVTDFLNKPIILGIRPEHIHFVNRDRPAGAKEIFEVTIERCESTGADTYITLIMGALSFVARADPANRCRGGQRAHLFFDLSQAHLFSAVTEQTLR